MKPPPPTLHGRVARIETALADLAELIERQQRMIELQAEAIEALVKLQGVPPP